MWFKLLAILALIHFVFGLEMGGDAGSLIDGDSEYEKSTSRNTKRPGATKKLPTRPYGKKLEYPAY